MIQQSTLDKWLPLFQEFEQSDCTITEFCSARGISYKSWYGARRKIAAILGDSLDQSLVPVAVVGTCSTAQVEINGIRVSFQADIDEACLAKLVRACRSC